MKLLAPSYYPEFSCIADRCRHNCCIGWEIDIDPDTARFYKSVGGTFGQRFSEHIDFDADPPCFRLTKDNRCPFLNACGLCDIITALGDTALCQICTDHPRYRYRFSDREEIGLGLCCEEAARRILSRNDPVRFTVLEDDGQPDCPTAQETAFFSMRDSLVETAQDRRFSIAAREERLLTCVGKPRRFSPLDYWRIYSPLERLDPAWDEVLQALKKPQTACEESAADPLPFEQLLVYFLHRHLPGGLDDGLMAERTAFAVHSTRLIRLLFCQCDNTLPLSEIARMYSAEIEYSDENIDALLSIF